VSVSLNTDGVWTRSNIFFIRANNNNNNNKPKPVTEHEDVTVLWNQGIQTDREVLANRPDIIIKNKKDKTYL
jgi:hypothetical protein